MPPQPAVQVVLLLADVPQQLSQVSAPPPPRRHGAWTHVVRYVLDALHRDTQRLRSGAERSASPCYMRWPDCPAKRGHEPDLSSRVLRARCNKPLAEIRRFTKLWLQAGHNKPEVTHEGRVQGSYFLQHAFLATAGDAVLRVVGRILPRIPRRRVCQQKGLESDLRCRRPTLGCTKAYDCTSAHSFVTQVHPIVAKYMWLQGAATMDGMNGSSST